MPYTALTRLTKLTTGLNPNNVIKANKNNGTSQWSDRPGQ